MSVEFWIDMICEQFDWSHTMLSLIKTDGRKVMVFDIW